MENKHVLLIGVDGCRLDALEVAMQQMRNEQSQKYQHFLSLFDQGAVAYRMYAGGHYFDSTKQATESAPGWTTIVSGVYSDQHGIRYNGDIVTAKYNKNIPTVWNYIKNAYPDSYTASVTDWAPLGILASLLYQGDPADKIITLCSEHLTDYIEHDKYMEARTTNEITKNQPKFMFTYLGAVDKVGHHSGFGPQNDKYIEAIKTAATQVDSVVQAVKTQREKGAQWLVIMLPDHGGLGKSHGGQSWQERQIFAVFQDPDDPRYRGGKIFDAVQGQTTVVATILDYLVEDYCRENYPLVHGYPIGTAPKTQICLNLSRKDENSTTYYVQDGFPALVETWCPGLSSYSDQIISAFGNANDERKVFFILHGSKYIQIDHREGIIDEGFPKDIDDGFPGLKQYSDDIIDAVQTDKKYYFFMKNGTYMSFDVIEAKFDNGFPKSMNFTWPGLSKYASSITTAIARDNSTFYFFLMDGTYLIYVDESVRQGKIQNDFQGLGPYIDDIVTLFNLSKSDLCALLRPLPFN